MKTYWLIVLFLLFSSILFSQQADSIKNSKNAIYVEILGSSFYWYNLSYDRIIASAGKHKISVAVGIQFPAMSKIVEEASKKSIAPQINYLFGRKEELEFGICLFYDLDSKDKVAFLRIGYRAQFKNELFFKIAFTPFIMKGGYPWPWAGLSIGWAF